MLDSSTSSPSCLIAAVSDVDVSVTSAFPSSLSSELPSPVVAAGAGLGAEAAASACVQSLVSAVGTGLLPGECTAVGADAGLGLAAV